MQDTDETTDDSDCLAGTIYELEVCSDYITHLLVVALLKVSWFQGVLIVPVLILSSSEVHVLDEEGQSTIMVLQQFCVCWERSQ